MQQSLNQYILRASIFLALIFIFVVLLYPVLQSAFISNIFVNMGNVVFQIQIAKNIQNLPLTRNYIYN